MPLTLPSKRVSPRRQSLDFVFFHALLSLKTFVDRRFCVGCFDVIQFCTLQLPLLRWWAEA